jgi:cobalamin biosynthesis protein CobD/CbiB
VIVAALLVVGCALLLSAVAGLLGVAVGRRQGYRSGHAAGFTTGQAQPRTFDCRPLGQPPATGLPRSKP